MPRYEIWTDGRLRHSFRVKPLTCTLVTLSGPSSIVGSSERMRTRKFMRGNLLHNSLVAFFRSGLFAETEGSVFFFHRLFFSYKLCRPWKCFRAAVSDVCASIVVVV